MNSEGLRRRHKVNARKLGRERRSCNDYHALADLDGAELQSGTFDNLSTPTRILLDRFKQQWDSFCNQVFPGEDPTERLLRTDEIATYISFLHWYMDQSQIRRVTSIIGVWNRACGYIINTLGPAATVKGLWSTVGVYIRTKMKEQYGLLALGQRKPLLDFEDLQSLMRHHWIYSQVIYPLERERVQLATFLLLSAYTGSRPGAIVESYCRAGSNRALRWRDVELYLWRRDGQVRPAILAKVTYCFRKGDERSEKPCGPDQTFTLYESDNLAMCPVLHLIALAFADHVFEAKNLLRPADLLRLRVPQHLRTLRLSWKAAILDVPVLRSVMKSGLGLSIDPKIAWKGPRVAHHLELLGRSAGMPYKLTSYCLRRATGNVVDSKASVATRNQVMGHQKGTDVFEGHYFSQNIRFDIQGAVSGTKSAAAQDLIEHTVSMGAYADPRAPFKLTPAQRQEAWCQESVLQKKAIRDAIRKQLRARFGTLSKCRHLSGYMDYVRATNDLHAERVLQEKLLFTKIRNQYFASSAANEIAQQLSSTDDGILEEGSGLTDSSSALSARKAFVDACYNDLNANAIHDIECPSTSTQSSGSSFFVVEVNCVTWIGCEIIPKGVPAVNQPGPARMFRQITQARRLALSPVD